MCPSLRAPESLRWPSSHTSSYEGQGALNQESFQRYWGALKRPPPRPGGECCERDCSETPQSVSLLCVYLKRWQRERERESVRETAVGLLSHCPCLVYLREAGEKRERSRERETAVNSSVRGPCLAYLRDRESRERRGRERQERAKRERERVLGRARDSESQCQRLGLFERRGQDERERERARDCSRDSSVSVPAWFI